MLTPEDYGLWSSIIPDQLSDDGNWASYRLSYKYTNSDTLILKNTKSNKRFVFPNATRGKFNAELDFACMTKDTLIIQNLNADLPFKRQGVIDFEFSSNQKFLAILIKQPNGKFTLEIRDRLNKLLQTSGDITYYRFEPAKNGLVYSIAGSDGNKIEMLLLEDVVIKKTIADHHAGTFQGLAWKGNSIVFIENVGNDPILFRYDLGKGLLSGLNPENMKGYPSDMKVSTASYRIPIISDDESKVFFWLQEPQLAAEGAEPSALQIWNTKDKLLYDYKNFGTFPKLSDKLAVWDLKDNKVLQITDKDLPLGFLNATYNTAFIYDPTAYQPHAMQRSPYDLYALDLKNGNKDFIVKKYSYDHTYQGSPDGRYLCYAKDRHWWVYDIQKKTSLNLTSTSEVSFFEEDTDRPEEDEPYGIGGWTNNGEIILYDKYDLWKISLDGKVKMRLTNGREQKKIYRARTFGSSVSDGSPERRKDPLDLKEGFLLTTANKETSEEGLSYWNSKSGIKDLVWGNKKILVTKKAKNKNAYSYIEQNFESAPRLVLYDGGVKEIVKSNTQQENFYWGRNERIEYVVDGKKMKGVLFYPAAFNPNSKYPMVVHIYERQSHYQNDYVNPTLFSVVGFNVSHFLANGYFVLYPDITYEFGNLRESVTKSVLAAVDKVIERGKVDPKKVGLIGHSFGGYETNLIITQTDRFAAAVSGAGWSDLVSTYFSVSNLFRQPSFFRTENHQLRIGKSLFQDMPAYLKNSPVLLADKVNTPLLGWAGKEDATINSLQSMEFYMALRRAAKEHTLLLYSGEDHTIEKKENALDLNARIMQWFDYYLKNGKKQEWMNSDYKR